MEEYRPERPLGIAILSVLDIIIGILGLLGGILLIAVGPFIMGMLPPSALPFQGLMAGVIFIIGIIVVILSLIAIFLGYLLWNGSNLARLLHIVFAVINIIGELLTLSPASLVGIIVSVIIIWYLTRPHVVKFFTYTE